MDALEDELVEAEAADAGRDALDEQHGLDAIGGEEGEQRAPKGARVRRRRRRRFAALVSALVLLLHCLYWAAGHSRCSLRCRR